jgi:hypothetical protein
MTIEELQAAIGTVPDGKWGPASKAALLAKFTNLHAPAIGIEWMERLAGELGCTTRQLAAVAAVESSGGGFDKLGRPKILFERHLFHRLTDGRWSPSTFSQQTGGGYAENSWTKLADACGKDPEAAFGACSWGKFQVLGLHALKLGFASSYAMALSTVESEAAHYQLLAMYVRTFGLADELRAISAEPDDCKAFAEGYNGPSYRRFNYHVRIAEAMA